MKEEIEITGGTHFTEENKQTKKPGQRPTWWWTSNI